MIPELAPREVQARLAGAAPPLLIDVREPWEFAIAHLPGAELIPLSTLPGVLPRLAREGSIVGGPYPRP